MVGRIAADLMKSKPQLTLENAFLRQQVIALKRQVARPELTTKDRCLLVCWPAGCAIGGTPYCW